jgi:hypothetical protein
MPLQDTVSSAASDTRDPVENQVPAPILSRLTSPNFPRPCQPLMLQHNAARSALRKPCTMLLALHNAARSALRKQCTMLHFRHNAARSALRKQCTMLHFPHNAARSALRKQCTMLPALLFASSLHEVLPSWQFFFFFPES